MKVTFMMMKSVCPRIPIVHLGPGNIYLAERPCIVTTVLGSCISVTMFAIRLQLGIICHGLLPTCNESSCPTNCTAGARYVDCSVLQMLKALYRMGARRPEIKVKIFGGAEMLRPVNGSNDSINVGRQNIISACRAIERHGLNLSASDIGGNWGRKILFYTHTGDVFLRRIGNGPKTSCGPYLRRRSPGHENVAQGRDASW